MKCDECKTAGNKTVCIYYRNFVKNAMFYTFGYIFLAEITLIAAFFTSKVVWPILHNLAGLYKG